MPPTVADQPLPVGRSISFGHPVHSGQVLLKGQVCEAPATGFAFEQQAAALLYVAEKVLHRFASHADSLERRSDDRQSVVGGDLSNLPLHHPRRERHQDHTLLIGGEITVLSAFGLAPASEQHLADLAI